MENSSETRQSGDTGHSWLANHGDAGNCCFVDIPLKPPLELRWKTKLKMPLQALSHAGRVVVTCQGGLAFQCAVGPWVEHMLAAEDALIIVGRGGTVFCYGEK